MTKLQINGIDLENLPISGFIYATENAIEDIAECKLNLFDSLGFNGSETDKEIILMQCTRIIQYLQDFSDEVKKA